jgi:hypothetical protein
MFQQQQRGIKHTKFPKTNKSKNLQVTSEPVLAPLLSELIHSTEGQEVRLREPADYHIHDLKNTTFAEVAEYARTKTETAIG